MSYAGSAFSTFVVLSGVYGSSVRGIHIKNVQENLILSSQNFIKQRTVVLMGQGLPPRESFQISRSLFKPLPLPKIPSCPFWNRVSISAVK